MVLLLLNISFFFTALLRIKKQGQEKKKRNIVLWLHFYRAVWKVDFFFYFVKMNPFIKRWGYIFPGLSSVCKLLNLISRVLIRRFSLIMRVYQLQLAFRVEVLSTHLIHIRRPISFWLEGHSCPFCSKTVRSFENADYRFLYLKGHQPRTTVYNYWSLFPLKRC